MATATALTVPLNVVSVAGAVSETLIEQLLAARLKLAALAEAFELDHKQRLLRAQQELTDQIAPILAAAPEPFDLKLVDVLAARAAAVAETDERDRRNSGRIDQIREMVDARIDELKKFPSERALLIKVLRTQSAKLEAELEKQEGRKEKLEEELERIHQELDDLTRSSAASTKSARKSKTSKS